MLNDKIIPIGIKFSEKREYLEDLANGKVYMNESGYFRKIDNRFRGDKFDGKYPFLTSSKWKIETGPFGNLKEKIIIPGECIKDFTVGFKNDDKIPLFCCSIVSDKILDLQENGKMRFTNEFVSEMQKFGEYYMIFDLNELIDGIQEYIDDNKIYAQSGCVEYKDIYTAYDIETFNFHTRNIFESFFIKDSSYCLQNEWRVLLDNRNQELISETENHLLINIKPFKYQFIDVVGNMKNCTFTAMYN